MIGAWLGREWQDYCMQLLQRRHAIQNAHSLQLVPDRDRGDLGMEAFSHDGCIYQCYAAEEPLETKKRYEKQRDKLTTDLAKLRDKQVDVSALLGQVIAHRYVFMVPIHDSKDLVTHAHAKSAEVVGWDLPFISSDFSIVIETDDAYATERRDVHSIPTPVIKQTDLHPAQKDAWTQSNPGLHEAARSKLAKVIASTGTLDRALEGLTYKYLEGENALERLRTIQPDTHRSVLAAKANKERLLVLEYAVQTPESHGLLATIAADFKNALLERYQTLTLEIAETLAWAAVAEWLMRCPLDFEVAS